MYLSVSELLRELRENSGIKNSPINTGKSRKLDTFWKLRQVSSKVILVWNISTALTSVYLSGHHCSNGNITTALMSVYPRRTDCLNWNIPITPTSVYPRGHDCMETYPLPLLLFIEMVMTVCFEACPLSLLLFTEWSWLFDLKYIVFLLTSIYLYGHDCFNWNTYYP